MIKNIYFFRDEIYTRYQVIESMTSSKTTIHISKETKQILTIVKGIFESESGNNYSYDKVIRELCEFYLAIHGAETFKENQVEENHSSNESG